MSLSNRITAMSVSHPFSINKKLDQYLSENLPDLMDEYKLSDSQDLADLNGLFEGYERRMSDLDSWKEGFDTKLDDADRRVNRLKIKHGIKGGE